MPIAPRVEQRGLPGVQANPSAPLEAFGGGSAVAESANAAQQTVTTLQRIAMEEKRKADHLAVTEAESLATQKRNERMWDPKGGAFTRRGREAFGVINEYGDAYNKDLDDIEKGLTNEDQRAAFRQVRSKQLSDLNVSLQKHTFEETRKYAQEVNDSSLTNARNDAVLNYQDRGKVGDSLELQRTLIRTYAKDNGLPAEWVKEETEKALSQTHTAVINRMLANGLDKDASAYMASVKDELVANDVVAVEGALEEGSRSGESFRLVDGYRKKGFGFTQMLAEARKIDDPKLRETVNDRIRSEQAIDDAAKRDREEKMYLNATNVIEGGGTYEMIPPGVRSQMPLQMRENLKRYYQDKVEGKNVVTNLGVYQDLKRMMADPTRRDEAMKYNLAKHINDIERPQLIQLINDQAGLRSGDPKVVSQLDGYRTDQQVVDSVLEQAGLNPGAKSGSAKALRVEAARDAIDKKVEEFSKQNKRRPTNEELRKIANSQMIEVVTKPGIIFDTKKRRFELEPGEEFEIEVPKADADEIAAELKKRGRPVTDAEILKWYMRSQGG